MDYFYEPNRYAAQVNAFTLTVPKQTLYPLSSDSFPDWKELFLSIYTDQQLLLNHLGLTLSCQYPPRIKNPTAAANQASS